jgi:parallel beta-helix repeat protein
MKKTFIEIVVLFLIFLLILPIFSTSSMDLKEEKSIESGKSRNLGTMEHSNGYSHLESNTKSQITDINEKISLDEDITGKEVNDNKDNSNIMRDFIPQYSQKNHIDRSMSPRLTVSKLQAFTPHSAINIDGNIDFQTQAASEGWDLGGSRDGTSTKPFLITGYSFTGSGTLVSIENTDLYFEFKNNVVNGGSIGFTIQAVYNAKVENNTFTGSTTWNIYVVLSHNNIFNNNDIEDTTEGLRFWDAGSNTITNNRFTNSGLVIEGGPLASYLQTLVSDNTVNGKPLIFCQQVNGGTYSSNAGQVFLMDCDSVTVTNMNVSSTSVGLFAINSDNLQIKDNIFSDNDRGIYLEGIGTSIIERNTIESNNDGLFVGTFGANTVRDNIISYNSVSGMNIYSGDVLSNTINNNYYAITMSSGNIIGNSLSSNSYGISSGQSYVADNMILNTRFHGIYSGNSSTYKNNTLTGVSAGFYVQDSIIHDFNQIINNTIKNTLNAIYLDYNGNNTFIDNNIIQFNSGDAIYVRQKTTENYRNVTVSNNIITNNTGDGIYFTNSLNPIINSNQVKFNGGYGLYLYNTGSSTIQNNNIDYNGGEALYSYNVDNSNFQGNSFNYNGDGVRIVSNCYFYQNSIIGNGADGLIISGTNTDVIDNDILDNVGKGITVIYGNNHIESNNINLNLDGIYLQSYSDHSTIKYNIIENNSNYGIHIYGYSSNLVENITMTFNTIRYNSVGIYSYFGTNNKITQNTISNNSHLYWGDTGIYLSASGSNTINDNFLYSNGIYVTGAITQTIQQSVVNNNIDGFPVYYLANQNSMTISSQAGQIILINSTQISISNQVFNSKGYKLIDLYSSSEIQIFDNEFYFNKKECIYIYGSDHVSVNENIFVSNSDYNIYGLSSDNNTYDNNEIRNSISHGIYSETSDDVIIRYNILENNSNGIYFISVTHSKLHYNEINQNRGFGIYALSSLNAEIIGNNLFNNSDEGIYLPDCPNSIISQNKVSFGNGIRITGSDGSTITYNFINSTKNGLYLFTSGNSEFQHNIFIENRIEISGYELADYLFIESNNTIDSQKLLYIQNRYNKLYTDPSPQIYVVNSTLITILNQNFKGTSYTPISILFSTNISIGKINCIDIESNCLQILESESVEVRDSSFYNMKNSAIYVSKTDYVKIFNITSNFSNSTGISLSYTNYVEIDQNLVINSNNYGIIVSSSTFVNITNNIVENDTYQGGISLSSTHYSIVSNNTLVNNSIRGIYIYNSNNNKILNNSIYEHDSEGISFINSDFNVIKYNHIENNFMGVYLYFRSDENTIISNTIISNTNYSIYLYYLSINNNITWNNIIDNNIGGISQAFDDSTDNLFDYNFWNDLIGPDSDFNGIVDTSYLINGNSNVDVHPLMSSVLYGLYPISYPQILYPNGGETISGIITINWVRSVEYYTNIVYFTVYYSSDGGLSWNELLVNTSFTSFEWNTSKFENSNEYLIKIVAYGSQGAVAVDYSDTLFKVENILHLLSKPFVINPNGGEIIFDSIFVQWTESTDSLGHTISYSMYYSPDGGSTWIEIVTGLTETSFSWNISSLETGGNYMIKVEAQGSEGLVAVDISDRNFTILQPSDTEPSTITAPCPTTETNTITDISVTTETSITTVPDSITQTETDTVITTIITQVVESITKTSEGFSIILTLIGALLIFVHRRRNKE